MHKPCSWIIGSESHNHPTTRRKGGYIAASRVIVLQSGRTILVVKLAVTTSKDIKVMLRR